MTSGRWIGREVFGDRTMSGHPGAGPAPGEGVQREGPAAADAVRDVHGLNLSGGRRIDGATLTDPALLSAGEALRLRILGAEHGAPPAAVAASGLGAGPDDPVAAEFGVFLDGIAPERIVGTVRLVRGRDGGFPINRICTIDPEYQALFTPGIRGIEIADLCVSRALGDDAGTGLAAGQAAAARRELQLAVVLMLYKCMYRWAKQRGITHVFAAMEPTLQRLARRSGFPFEPIGPAASYHGRVFPYLLEIAHLERHLYTRMPHVWRFLTEEPAAQPAG